MVRRLGIVRMSSDSGGLGVCGGGEFVGGALLCEVEVEVNVRGLRNMVDMEERGVRRMEEVENVVVGGALRVSSAACVGSCGSTGRDVAMVSILEKGKIGRKQLEGTMTGSNDIAADRGACLIAAPAHRNPTLQSIVAAAVTARYEACVRVLRTEAVKVEVAMARLRCILPSSTSTSWRVRLRSRTKFSALWRDPCALLETNTTLSLMLLPTFPHHPSPRLFSARCTA